MRSRSEFPITCMLRRPSSALRAKKHLYLQKPMATTLHECRVITGEAAKAGVVTQLGNQLRSSIDSRMTVQLIRSGVIGRIKEVLLWENKPLNWWPRNTELRRRATRFRPASTGTCGSACGSRARSLGRTYHPKTWRAWPTSAAVKWVTWAVTISTLVRRPESSRLRCASARPRRAAAARSGARNAWWSWFLPAAMSPPADCTAYLARRRHGA